MQTEIAVLRFGLGARPGDFAGAAGDPRGWLMSQFKGAVARAGNTALAPSDQILARVLAARQEKKEMQREVAGTHPATQAVGNGVPNLVRDASLPADSSTF